MVKALPKPQAEMDSGPAKQTRRFDEHDEVASEPCRDGHYMVDDIRSHTWPLALQSSPPSTPRESHEGSEDASGASLIGANSSVCIVYCALRLLCEVLFPAQHLVSSLWR